MEEGQKPKGLQEQIGRRLRNMRKRRGMTQEELGAAAGVTGKFIGTVERGEMYPSMQTLEELSRALLCDLRFFFERDFDDPDGGSVEQAIIDRLKDMTEQEKKTLLRLVNVVFERD